MALVDRLMGLSPTEPKIHVHAFFAAASEVIAGRLTNTQVKNYLNLDAAGISEYDALAATAPTGTTTAAEVQKAHWVQKMHAVFVLAEERIPGYATEADVKAKLGI